jgi:hypothetical protein
MRFMRFRAIVALSQGRKLNQALEPSLKTPDLGYETATFDLRVMSQDKGSHGQIGVARPFSQEFGDMTSIVD